MKKVSTVRTEQSRNICQQRLTIGLDLGDRDSWYHRANESLLESADGSMATVATRRKEIS